jgi:carnitine monooxygenase subunit
VRVTRVETSRYHDPVFAERERWLWKRVWLPAAHRDEGTVTRRIAGRLVTVTVDGATVEGRAIAQQAWGGFSWINLDATAPPLAAHLGPITPLLEAYSIDGWLLESSVRATLACNWKASVDAHNEGYHVASVHPELLPMVDEASERIDLFGDHSRIAVPMGRPSRRLGETPLAAPLRDALLREGIDPSPFELRPRGAREARQRARRPRAPARLDDDQLTDDHQICIFPNLQLNLFFDHALVFRHWPDDDPGRCCFEQLVIRAPRAGERPRHVACREVGADDSVFGPVTRADLALLPRLQRGLASSGLSELVLGEREAAIRHFHGTVDRWLEHFSDR